MSVTTRQVSDENLLTQIWLRDAMRHAERRDSHLEIDPFRQTQPMQCCNGVCDVVVS